jgi:hypothetical protein
MGSSCPSTAKIRLFFLTTLGETLEEEPCTSRDCNLILSDFSFFLSKLVNCTHLAELVKKGVVDQMDASPMFSVSQTHMGVPVPQAGRVCSAMKVCTNQTPG